MDTYLDVAGVFTAKKVIQLISTLASTVDQDNTAAQRVLNIAATGNFLSGEKVVIGKGTAREEIKIINTVQDGVSFAMTENLANEHTTLQADAVENALKMSSNATGTVDDAAVTYYNATWQAMACSGLDDDLVDDPTPQLGEDLDTNAHNIKFDDVKGILDDSGNEQLIFGKTASAVNYLKITNSASTNCRDTAFRVFFFTAARHGATLISCISHLGNKNEKPITKNHC